MKIRDRMIISHLAVTLIPITVTFLSITIIIRTIVAKELANRLDDKMNSIVEKIQNDIDSYRKHATLFARNLSAGGPVEFTILTPTSPLSLAKYNIDIAEFTTKSKVFRAIFVDAAYAGYVTTPDYADYLWDYLSNPYFHREFDVYIPQVVSNALVVRCAAICYDYNKEEKSGMSITSLVMDRTYLTALSEGASDLVVFYQIGTNFSFSSNTLPMDASRMETLEDTNILENNTYLKINFPGKGQYFLKKAELFKIPGSDTIVYAGILYGFEFMNRFDILFRTIMLVILLVSLAIAIPTAYVSTKLITAPIVVLNDNVRNFRKDFTIIPPPDDITDEIAGLHKTFSEMSASIIDYSKKLENYQVRLSKEVDEKTADLKEKIQTLLLINNFSSFSIRIDPDNELDFIRQTHQAQGVVSPEAYRDLFAFVEVARTYSFHIVGQTPRKKEPAGQDDLHRRPFHRKTEAARRLDRQEDRRILPVRIARLFHRPDRIRLYLYLLRRSKPAASRSPGDAQQPDLAEDLFHPYPGGKVPLREAREHRAVREYHHSRY
jgi:HAMP domain-containing protein